MSHISKHIGRIRRTETKRKKEAFLGDSVIFLAH